VKVLIAYATVHGSTAEVAERMKPVFEKQGFDVTTANVKDLTSVEGYDAYVIGSPIYAGMWLTEISHFLSDYSSVLATKPSYLWIMGIRVLEADGKEHALQYYVHQHDLQRVGVKDVGVFAGKLNLDEIDWNERWTLSIRYDGKEMPGTFNDDYRNWDEITAWAEKVAGEIKSGG
jgi:menaquinone-dependent protoporphyrinogen oxidase